MSPADFEPGRWHKVIGPDGELWLETSNRQEAIDAMRPGDTLYREYIKVETEWREEKL